MSGRAAATITTLLGFAFLAVAAVVPSTRLPPPPEADRAQASLAPLRGEVREHAALDLPALDPPDVEGTRAFRPLEDVGPKLPRSKAVGLPNGGRLKNGVQVPAQSEVHWTFDSALRRSPSRGWRRWGTELTVHRTMRVLEEYLRAHPRAARIGIGDISREDGGPFGRDYGGLGHASHQNGRDVDMYWPRKDRLERPPRNVKQVNKRLAQDLVDRFVDAGAEMIFVGPKTHLKGPKGVVIVLVGHDDHMHVRWPAK